MSKNYYDILGLSKTASQSDIKKAYRKLAMKYHPDRAKSDKKTAEKKFKEIQEAYDTLSDTKKRKNYDMFGSAKGNPFGGGTSYTSGGFAGFEDIFGGAGKYSSSSSRTSGNGFEFNIEDLFGGTTKNKTNEKAKVENLDFEKTYEIPIFDFILGGTLDVKGVYGQTKKIKIPKNTKPGTKMRIKGFGKKESGREDGNLIINLKAKMPKYISDIDKQMLERIKENVGY